jgi:outer membrane protein TolC
MRFGGMILSSVMAAAATAAAQDGVVRVTLQDAVARGIDNSHRLAEMRARADAANAVEAARVAARLPSIALQGAYTRTNHVEEFGLAQPSGPPRLIYPDIPDNYRTRVDLQWPIYTGGRADALERAAAAEHDASTADVASARGDLRLEVSRAYWALVTARATEQVLAGTLSSMDAHVRDLASRLEQGLIPPNDLLSAQAQQSRQRVLSIEAQNAAAVAEADLQRLLGLDRGQRVEPADTLDGVPASAADLDALVAESLRQRPERQALQRRVDAADARLVAADASGRPQVAVTGGYDYARPNPRIFPRSGDWRDSWDVSVNASWSLWDGGRRQADQAEAAANARAARERVAEFDRQVVFEVRQRWLEADSSRAGVAAADAGVRSATEARRVVHERFNAGVATSTEVLDADVAVLQAELDRTRALANVRLAEARLERAVGRQ